MAKKILYLHQYFIFPDESGGTRSYDLSRSFLNEGYDVEIVTSTSDEKYRDRKGWFCIEKEGLKVHYIYMPYDNNMSYLKRIMVFLKFMVSSSRKVLSLEKDLVLATSTPLTIGIPAMINRSLKKTPFIFEVRDVWPEAVIAIGAINNGIAKKMLYSLEKTIYKRSAAIVPLSEDMKSSIVTRYPEFEKKISCVIENISEINRFQAPVPATSSVLTKHGIPEGRFPILYAGTFGRVNGLGYLVKLAEKTSKRDQNIIYILAGRGAEKDGITSLLEEKGLLNRTVFVIPPLLKKDLPLLYSEVSMGSSFVIPVKELWANSANKFFDTLAAGRPVLINHGGWQQSVIEKENIGYVLPPVLDDRAVDDFVNYTQDLKRHSIQCANALNKAKSSYSLEVAAQKYISVFRQIGCDV